MFILSASKRRKIELEENIQRKDLTQEEIDRNIIEIVELAKAIDVEDSDLRSESERKSKKPANRPPKAIDVAEPDSLADSANESESPTKQKKKSGGQKRRCFRVSPFLLCGVRR